MMRPRVLVIEDNAAGLELVCTLLEGVGCDVLTAATAKAGLAAARAEGPDLILMDVQLPGMDGYEATFRLKSDSRTAKIPVVAVTAHAMRGEEDQARAAGCDGYLTKPIREQEFFGLVRRFI